MSKKVLLIILGIVIVGAGALAYWNSLKQSSFEDVVRKVEADSKRSSGTVDISISNYIFTPQVVKVEKGTKVVWTNKDNTQHTVTGSDQTVLDSPSLGQGKTYEKVFDKTGTFKYHCTPHPGMVGAIVVVEK